MRCLLSADEHHIDLVGYCGFDGMLTYRLDTECALILVSAVDCGAPGSASAAGAAGDACPTATIEHVTKLSKDEVAVLTRSLAEEWKAILTTATPGSANVAGTPERPILQESPKDQTASTGRRSASAKSGACCRSPVRRWRPLGRWLHSVRTTS